VSLRNRLVAGRHFEQPTGQERNRTTTESRPIMIDPPFEPASTFFRPFCMIVSSALCLALLLSPAPGAAQRSQSGMGSELQSQMQNQIGHDPLDDRQSSPMGLNDPVALEKRLKALNAERQKAMIADTNKLVKLAAQLNAEINGKHPGELTPDQLHQVAEIEKLARSVKEKMCTSVRPSPMMQQPSMITPPGMSGMPPIM
jgi:hypothetical protein